MATETPKTLIEAVNHFSDPKVCEDALVASRWPRGVVCPTCGSDKVRRLEAQKRWECSNKHPRRQFSAKKGTIFEDSPISLSKWFVAIWLISSAKNGISSYELSRAIGVTQKSAWFVLHRIRLAMISVTTSEVARDSLDGLLCVRRASGNASGGGKNRGGDACNRVPFLFEGLPTS